MPEKRAIIYYSHDQAPQLVLDACREQLLKVAGNIPIISVTHKEAKSFGRNLKIGHYPHNHITLYFQIMLGMEASGADIVYLVEHDVLYPEEYFDWTPPDDDKFHYQINNYYITPKGFLLLGEVSTSQLVCRRSWLMPNLWERTIAASEGRYIAATEPGKMEPCDPSGRWRLDTFRGKYPAVDIRHGHNFTGMRGDENSKYLFNIPYWGDYYVLADKLGLRSK